MVALCSDDENDLLYMDSIVPIREMAAYEALWARQKVSYKILSEQFRKYPNSLPSSFTSPEEIKEFTQYLNDFVFSDKSVIKPKILINNTFDYPKHLRDAKDPIEVLYYSGNLDLLSSRSVAIVGTRKPTEQGKKRTDKLVKLLVKDDYTIVSGLAQGIDSQAHHSALSVGGKTIAVIGTPLNKYYPKENKALQEYIADEHLLISQVPFYRHSKQGISGNRLFFPERNKTMSALTLATIIIEASETSGTLIQARAALEQGRKLFILQSCFENPNITWPARFEKKGAIRVRTYDDIKNNLPE